MCRKSPASRAAAVNAPKVRALARPVAQQLPGQQEEHRDRDGAGRRSGDAPAELVVAEQLDAGPDHPVAERRVRPAGELVDAAFGRADHVAARIAGIPDLVEHEAHGAAEPGQAQAAAPAVTARSAIQSRRDQPGRRSMFLSLHGSAARPSYPRAQPAPKPVAASRRAPAPGVTVAGRRGVPSPVGS